MTITAVRSLSDDDLVSHARAHMAELDQQALARGPLGLARYLDPNVKARPHLRAISDALESLQPGSDARVMVFTPPQVGKSFSATWGVFWWLAQNPEHRNVIIGSCSTRLAATRGRTIRKYVNEHGHRYGLAIERGSAAVTDWTLAGGGKVRSAGTNAGIAGDPGDFALIDDPFSGRADAESRARRNRVYDWWSGDLNARLSPGSPILIVNTRWHLDDLSGRLLAEEGMVEEGGVWRVVFLPAFAVEPDREEGIPADGLGRAIGEPLTHPKIKPGDRAACTKHWERKKRTSTPRDWASLYMCQPREEKDALVSRDVLREARVRTPPPAERKAVSIDPSGGGRSTAGILAGYTAGDQRLYVTDDVTDVLKVDEWAERACMLAYRTSADLFYVERNFGGAMAQSILLSTWKDLRRRGEIPAGTPLPFVQEVNARQNKRIRAEPMAQQIMLGNLRLVGIHSELEHELSTWSVTDTDSPGRVDALTHMAFGMLVGIGDAADDMMHPADANPDDVTGAAGFPDYQR